MSVTETRSVCECGCGQEPTIAKRNIRGFKKGQHFRFVKGHGRVVSAVGWIDKAGYVRRSATRNGIRRTTSAHWVIAENALGKSLPAKAVVHHHDENKANNSNANLVICQDQAYHQLLHARMRILKVGGDPNTQKICGRCHELKERATDFRRSAAKYDGLDGRCRQCAIRGSVCR